MTVPPVRRGRFGGLRATQWPMVVGLMVLWVLLWGNVTFANVLTGLLIGLLVCAVFPLPAIETQLRLHPLGVLRFAARFLSDMVTSSWRLGRVILAPGKPPCAVLAVPMRCPGDLMLTATAVAISAVPGSTVLEVHRATGTLYLHVIGAPTETERQRARHEALRLESRVVRAFGTRTDINAVTAAEQAGTAAELGKGAGPWT
ncbi:Na+/H+ antiporter subunit E [Streptomyces sp. AJS327]|uniref:Na+/H+ antiporter subunit E n=1 Tax=Streptomyces sp. AJS327 TaxID=2545265 RepID=UPI0015DF61E7|nr:Na+/H+ antiporter subunit E [Streptomyces sp. AJS327]MBA0050384.1 Na+/H+ antiporter subunit E [Streptomyces sp. AJS327]